MGKKWLNIKSSTFKISYKILLKLLLGFRGNQMRMNNFAHQITLICCLRRAEFLATLPYVNPYSDWVKKARVGDYFFANVNLFQEQASGFCKSCQAFSSVHIHWWQARAIDKCKCKSKDISLAADQARTCGWGKKKLIKVWYFSSKQFEKNSMHRDRTQSPNKDGRSSGRCPIDSS